LDKEEDRHSMGNQHEGTERMDYMSLRLDRSLREALVEAANAEHRPLSNFCRLLLEYAFSEYQRVGSIRDLLSADREEARIKEG
jgi:uncharacterized protein (DUF1778 family)